MIAQRTMIPRPRKTIFLLSLKKANSEKKSFPVDDANVTVLVRAEAETRGDDERARVVDGAQDGILFLFFNLGHDQSKDIAETTKTLSYEVTCGVSQRLRRLYLGRESN